MNYKIAAVLGAGFIGKNLIRYLLNLGYEVNVLDHNACPKEFENKTKWVSGSFSDIKNLEEVIDGVDVVFHLIGNTVPGDNVDEIKELTSNVIDTINFLKVCLKLYIKKVVFVSSAAVYGLQRKMPISEIAETNPISTYGINKLTIEKYMQYYKHEHGMDCKIMRLSNPYGIGQNISGRQGFIAIAVGNILARKPVMMRGCGDTIRDYIYIDDVSVACHLLAITDSQEVVFNIGGGSGISLNDIIFKMKGILKKEIDVEYIADRKTDIPISVLDITKAKELLGFTASIGINEGLDRLINYHILKDMR